MASPARTTIELRFGDVAELERHWREHLCRGGAWLAGTRLDREVAIDLLLIAPGGARLTLAVRAVFADASGTGLAIDGFGPAVKAQLDELRRAAAEAPAIAATPPTAAAPAAPAAPAADSASADDAAADDPDAPDRDPLARNVYERLRHLSMVEQHKVARDGEPHERIALERIYGKSVWEPLLRNPRLTHPEVARIARMGALPRPLLELIVGNGAWLKGPEVRRALLANPRLAPDQAIRILRLLPKAELKLVPQQTAYPAAVRDLARRLLVGGAIGD